MDGSKSTDSRTATTAAACACACARACRGARAKVRWSVLRPTRHIVDSKTDKLREREKRERERERSLGAERERDSISYRQLRAASAVGGTLEQ